MSNYRKPGNISDFLTKHNGNCHAEFISASSQPQRRSRNKFGMTILISLLLTTFYLLLTPPPAHAANSGIFTVELWVKPTSSIASQALVGKAEELRVFTDSSGNAGCQIKSSSTWQTASTGTQGLTLQGWNHVACTYDKATLKIYVNGVLAKQQALTTTIDDTANAIKIGQDDSASTPYSNLTGVTDDFRFYNYARTQKQVVQDMNGGHPLGGSPVGSQVGYWKFDEGYGTTAHNRGNGGSVLDGTLTNMASPATATSGWTNSGKFAKALNFDGSDDFIQINSAPNLTDSVTMSAWIKPTTAFSGFETIFDSQSSADTYNNQYNMFLDSNGKVNTYYTGLCTSNTALSLNNWTYVAITGTTTQLNIYINGMLDQTCNQAKPSTTTTILRFGARSATTNRFTGSLDEVKVYSSALTAQEVQIDYNHGSAIGMGVLGTDTSGNPSNSADRAYCPPGDTTATCGPVGEWNFEEGSGSSVNDTSGNGNTGTWNGTGPHHWIQGHVGWAGNFNGSDDYVALSNANNLSPGSGNMTIEAWVKSTLVDGNEHWIYSDYGSVTNNLVLLRLNSSNKFEAFYRDGSGNVANAQSNTVSPSQWYHVSAIRQGTTVSLYVNGSLAASTANASLGTITSSDGTTPAIGRNNQSNISYWAGRIDQVRIYNYARSQAQVAWDYNKGAPVGWWKFDECQGTTAHDSSGNGNNGTITIGASGTQTSAGTCTDGLSTSAWNNGAVGKYNSSLNFDGTDDYVQTSASIPTGLSGSFSVWAYPDSSMTPPPTNYPKIMGWTSSDPGLYIQKSTGKPYIQVTISSTAYAAVSTEPLIASTWQHIVVTWDSTSGTNTVLNVYLNGIKTVTQTISGVITQPNSAFNMGNSNYKGQIDDVRIYNYALTSQQIEQLYNQGSAIRFGPSTGSP